ncbi:hypothetical protein DFJ58DRAFT_200914 [Suillus subalutaceus]|uniref:uncharacterized protein n=1 Tax=Suillus subalutaceus TaxID=48586 RepID=UPI001B879A1E|nr:uncharacterized protein DFJ58DRAFT_200914 [Suillus subalutaceus]KAG1835769.1 hypothetical protein DFJ58DRAFT_200914 [Suillus subalutaceus]
MSHENPCKLRARHRKLVVEKGDGRVVREVLRYRQVREETVIYPPACFKTSGKWIADRAEFAQQVLGTGQRVA